MTTLESADVERSAFEGETADRPLKLLASFFYFKDEPLDEILARFRRRPYLFADSGAYSAGMQGVEINLADYVRWLRRWEGQLTTYVNLDVVHYKARDLEGDAQATWLNQRRLEDLGLSPVPVFHGGEPWEYLERYLERGHKYIALGGMVGAPTAVMRWLIQCFKLARQAGAVFHGFGQTTDSYVRDLPWFSIDSSSWVSGSRYGSVTLWDPKATRFCRVKVGDRKGVYARAELIRSHGGDPLKIADRAHYHYKLADETSVIAYRRYESWLRRRHGAVPAPPETRTAPQAPGPHLYFAMFAQQARGFFPALDDRLAPR